MINCLLSLKIQNDIVKVLSVFYPYAMTAEQYISFFGDVDEFILLANIEVLIRQGLIHPDAIWTCAGEQFLWLTRLSLLSKGNDRVNNILLGQKKGKKAMKTNFSDYAQWGILEYLFRIYPRTMSELEVRREFGAINNKGLIANIRQLISEGSVEQNAIVEIMGRDTVSPDGLKLTRDGTRLVRKSLHSN